MLTTATISFADLETETLAEIANEAAGACERSAETAVQHAIRCGRALNEVKSRLKHGEWLPWLSANFSYSQKQSSTFMKLAQNSSALRISDAPSIRDALKMISEADDKPKRTRQIAPAPAEETVPEPVQAAKSLLPTIAPAVSQPKTFADRAKSYVEQKKIGIPKSAYGEVLDEITALMKKYADEFPDHISVLISTIRHFEKKHLQK